MFYRNHQFATWLNSVLFIYCSVTNYHMCGSLKQHTFILSQFLQVQSLCVAYVGSLLQDLSRVCSQGVG